MRSKFGSYNRLFEIGRGGMATVYRATAPDGHLVALKLLGIHLATDKTAINRFRTESQLGLDHPNIVRVNYAGVIEDVPFIEMEYVPGESLDRLIQQHGPLTPAQFAPILEDAARALDYAHGRNVIHRDVKPSNILIRSDGRAMLADFGVAKAANITAYTATAARVGSVFYMSPEQAAGAYNITHSTDIYSLGVTSYYALSGRHPFEGDNDVAIARQHVDQLPPHVCVVKPDLPRPIGDVVMSALEKMPERRPASAGAFAQAFVAALSAPQVIAPVMKPAPVKRTPMPVEPPPTDAMDAANVEGGGPIPRSAWWMIGVVAAIAALLAVVAFFAFLAGPPQRNTGTPNPSATPAIGVIVASSTPSLTATPTQPAIVATVTSAPVVPSPTFIFILPTANMPPTPTPLVINPIIPTQTPVVFPTFPVVLPTVPPPPTSIPPTLPPTATPTPTSTPLPPTDTPVPPPPTDTPVPPPPTDTPAAVITVIVAP